MPREGKFDKQTKIKVSGVKGEAFDVKQLEPIKIKYGVNEIRTLKLLYVPEAGINIMGRDLMSALGLTISFDKNETAYVLTEEKEQKIDPLVWVQPGNRGGLEIEPLKIKLKPQSEVVSQKQYNISMEGRKGLQPIIDQLVKDGLLEGTMSPYNTPILPVRKPDGTYRIVQDLRLLNFIVETRHPVVPNPYTILGKIPVEHKWFSVVDLKDAFWSCPLDKDSRALFAFEWENPFTGRKQQYQWTVLPQGFTESPNLFGQVLEQTLEKFKLPKGVKMIQYVDDLLISGKKKTDTEEGTIALLNFLAQQGLRVSKGKLQFVEQEVKYLGHLISQGSRRISAERIQGIVEQSRPKTQKELRKFLGLIGYCRLWIEDYAKWTKKLYEQLIQTKPFKIGWTKELDEDFQKLKHLLVSAPVLSLPNLDKPFHLFVSVEGGVALGILTQNWAGQKKPVAYLSENLDSVAQGWPTCIQAIAAVALLVKKSEKITMGGALIVSSPHQVRTLLKQKAGRWLTDSRLLKYEGMLLDHADLVLTTDSALNPAQFLNKTSSFENDEIEHWCSEIVDLETKIRPDLQDIPLTEGERWYIDGSSRVVEGKRQNGYAIIQEGTWALLEGGRLPNHWSAQAAELYALKRALILGEKLNLTIYTDSKYAFGVVQTFGKIWKERGYVTSQGKDLIHQQLVEEVLSALVLPHRIAVVHLRAHQKGEEIEKKGNRLADQEAKEAGMSEIIEQIKLMIPHVAKIKEIPTFNEKEEDKIKKIGGIKDKEGKWWLPDGRQILNYPLMRQIFERLHEGSHWGTQALIDEVLKRYAGVKVYTAAQQVTQKCIICQRVNRNQLREKQKGGRPLALYPFQNIQIDFTEMPQVGRYKYLLVIVDHLTGWVEAYPCFDETTRTVSRLLLEHIIPRYGIVQRIDSDQGKHFTGKITQGIANVLGIKWDLHSPWCPPSSGKVENMNGRIKTMLTKLYLETGMNWMKTLPIALFRIRTQPRRDVGISPYEMLFGMPLRNAGIQMGNLPSKDKGLIQYLQILSQTFDSFRKTGYLIQTPPLSFKVHSIEVGDQVWIKTWKDDSLKPKWDGPFLVLLTTDTAIRTQEKGWTHYTRVKKANLEESETWKAFQKEPLKLVLKRQ
ncbi:protein NYNRIN-like [Crotalus tigris]|uniref:protein NYNRIN-like n=1 Tax=Crotalus tigris TaxID=88082 RepID=UPI00192F250C|nr:protein NYNRIN-like [Crotalus tigris]